MVAKPLLARPSAHAAGERGALAPLFPHQRILQLQAQTIRAGLVRNRDVLLAGLSKAFAASLRVTGDHAAQILADLAAMNQTGRLPDGTLPLEIWLENACALTAALTEGEVFRSALNDLLTASATKAESFSGVGDWRAITRSLPSLPSYPDAETRRLSEQLEAVQARKWAIAQVGGSTAEVDDEIRELRRRLREGGQLKAGDSLGNGRYLLLERLGRGGFAVVWKAHDRARNECVAVKVLHSEHAADPVRKARFFRGARVMASIEHDAVVRVFDPHVEDSGYHYFVMELVAGGDLRHAVLEGRLMKNRVIPLILRVGEVVAITHQRGLVHRDIKPANILLDAAGEPKLTDFDLVGGKETTGGTQTGPMGTMFYAAPEAMKNAKEADARADVYSLGMTAVFALSGAELPMDVLRNTNQVIEGLACTSDVKDVLKQATAWTKEERFAGAGAFCAAFRDAISGTDWYPAAPPAPAPPAPEVTGIRRSPQASKVIERKNEVSVAPTLQVVPSEEEPPSHGDVPLDTTTHDEAAILYLRHPRVLERERPADPRRALPLTPEPNRSPSQIPQESGENPPKSEEIPQIPYSIRAPPAYVLILSLLMVGGLLIAGIRWQGCSNPPPPTAQPVSPPMPLTTAVETVDPPSSGSTVVVSTASPPSEPSTSARGASSVVTLSKPPGSRPSSSTGVVPPPPTEPLRATLNFNTSPASRSEVKLDGQSIGYTPITGRRVPAGSHQVTFIHPDFGEYSKNVEVNSEEKKTVTATY